MSRPISILKTYFVHELTLEYRYHGKKYVFKNSNELPNINLKTERT